MKIQFRSRHGQPSVRMRQFLGHELGSWSDGQIRDVPDDLTVAYKPLGERVKSVNAVSAILLGGPDFVDADTGINPDYQCAQCGRETLATHWIDNNISDGSDKRVAFVDENGAPLCVRDYLLRLPTNHYLWQKMRAVEFSTDLQEAEAELAKRAAAPQPAEIAANAPVVAVAAAPVTPAAVTPAKAPAPPLDADAKKEGE